MNSGCNIIVSKKNISLGENSLIQIMNLKTKEEDFKHENNMFEKCISVEDVFFKIMEFLGSFTVKYVLVKRNKKDCNTKFKISSERKMYKDMYLRHLKKSHNTGLGCPIVPFYLRNTYDNILLHMRTIPILNKECNKYSNYLYKFRHKNPYNVINNILYRKEHLDFLKKYTVFLKREHKCTILKNSGKIFQNDSHPFDCDNTGCLNCYENYYELDSIQNKEYCKNCLDTHNNIKNHPYICNCNDYRYMDSYVYDSCDVCAVINKDYKRGPPLWRIYKKCEVCKKGQVDMLADNYDSDDY